MWNLGTIAKGSVLLLIFAFPRHILKLIYDFVEENPEAKQTKWLNYIGNPFKELYNKYLIGINNNGYCLSALYGGSFIDNGVLAEDISTYHLFEDRWDIISNLGSMFIYIAKFCVTVCIGLLTYLILHFVPYYKENIFSAKFPTFIIMLFIFICSACVIDMYATLTDSFLICFFIGEGSNNEYYEFKENLI